MSVQAVHSSGVLHELRVTTEAWLIGRGDRKNGVKEEVEEWNGVWWQQRRVSSDGRDVSCSSESCSYLPAGRTNLGHLPNLWFAKSMLCNRVAFAKRREPQNRRKLQRQLRQPRARGWSAGSAETTETTEMTEYHRHLRCKQWLQPNNGFRNT